MAWFKNGAVVNECAVINLLLRNDPCFIQVKPWYRAMKLFNTLAYSDENLVKYKMEDGKRNEKKIA